MYLPEFREHLAKTYRRDETVLLDLETIRTSYDLDWADWCDTKTEPASGFRHWDQKHLWLACPPDRPGFMHVFRRLKSSQDLTRRIDHKKIDTPGGWPDQDFEWFLSRGLNRAREYPTAVIASWPEHDRFPPRDAQRNATGVF